MTLKMMIPVLLLASIPLAYSDKLKIVVTYDSANSGGAKDGAIRAIEEFVSQENETSHSIDVQELELGDTGDDWSLCKRIFNHQPDFVVDVSMKSPGLIRVVHGTKLPTMSASLEEVKTNSSLISRRISTYNSGERSALIHFKSPTQLLLEAIRDLNNKYSLDKNYLRVLYDGNYCELIASHVTLMAGLIAAQAIDSLKPLLPNTTEFVSLEEPLEVPLVKKIRRMRKPAMSTFIVLASSDVVGTLSKVINQADMFRSAYTWIFITKDKRRINCEECKHAVLNVLQPVVCTLHEYTGSLSHNASRLVDRVDYYFYYDLVRMTLPALMRAANERRLPVITAGTCDRFRANSTSGELATPADSIVPSNDAVDFDLSGELFESSLEYHGRYGEFVIHPTAKLDGNEIIEQNTISNYQDIAMRIFKVIYLRQKRTMKKHATWFYQEPEGIIMSRAYQEEDGEEAPGGEVSESASEDSEGGGDEEEAALPEGCDDDEDPRFKKGSKDLIFLVNHHPPFIFIKTQNVASNSTMIQKTADNTTAVNYYYEGFMIDLLTEIVSKYKTKFGKDFPAHYTQTSKKFLNCKDGGDAKVSKCGFGIKNLPKAGAGGKEEDNDEAKKFYGLVNEVRCDPRKIALMPMTMTPERNLVVAFSEPFFDTVSLSVMMKKPVLMYHFWKFVSVLEYSVWICITIAYFFTSIVLWIFDRSSPYSYQNDPERYADDDEKRIFSLKESLWFCITSLTPQGGGEAPKPLSGRLIAATWWLFGFIIIASYTANLAAFLTVSRLDHPIHDFHQLTRQYKVKYSPLEGSSTRSYFERMARIEERFYEVWKDLSLSDELEEEERAMLAVWDYPVSDRATKIWAQMVEATFPVGYDQALHKVRSSKVNERVGYALVAETTIIDHAIKVHCDVMKVGGEFLPRPNSIMFNKNQKPLMDEVSQIIHEMKEDGSMDKLRIKWWITKIPARKCHEHRKLYNGVTLKNVGGIFIVVAVGVITTLILLRCENWYYEKKVIWDAQAARLAAVQGPAGKPTVKKSKCSIL